MEINVHKNQNHSLNFIGTFPPLKREEIWKSKSIILKKKNSLVSRIGSPSDYMASYPKTVLDSPTTKREAPLILMIENK